MSPLGIGDELVLSKSMCLIFKLGPKLVIKSQKAPLDQMLSTISLGKSYTSKSTVNDKVKCHDHVRHFSRVPHVSHTHTSLRIAMLQFVLHPCLGRRPLSFFSHVYINISFG